MLQKPENFTKYVFKNDFKILENGQYRVAFCEKREIHMMRTTTDDPKFLPSGNFWAVMQKGETQAESSSLTEVKRHLTK